MNGLDPDFGSKCPDYERRSGQKSPKMSGFLNGNSGEFSGVLVRHFEKWLGNVLYELCELEVGHLQMKLSLAHVVASSESGNEA